MIAGDEIHAEERMNLLDMLINGVVSLLPMGLVVFIGGGGIWLLNRIMTRRSAAVPGKDTFRRQLILVVLGTVLLLAIIVSAPLPESTRANLITLFGIALTATIALSTTTLASNAMAGLMLRIISNFKRGDFIRIDQFLGRVTEQGLFHTEIQNERSDLVTLPNLFVASTPVTVVRLSGTFISAKVSLGYDVSHEEIEKHLIKAAESAGLVGDREQRVGCDGELDTGPVVNSNRLTLLRVRERDDADGEHCRGHPHEQHGHRCTKDRAPSAAACDGRHSATPYRPWDRMTSRT